MPKSDRNYDVLTYLDLMYQGKVNGYIVQGFNPIAAFPDSNKVQAALSKLKFLVTIDPLATETSTFWQNHGHRPGQHAWLGLGLASESPHPV